MPQSEPSFINQLQTYRPPCAQCGMPMMLARIEPTAIPKHDLRTFDCPACGHSETLKVEYE